MKRTILFSAAALLAVIVAFSSCTKQADSIPSSTSSSSTTKNIDVSGTWKVSSWVQRTEDKTSSFKDYAFAFATGGTATATHGSSADNGTWSYTPSSVGYYGTTPSKASFTVNFGSVATLSKLNRTWNIDSTKTTATKLALINPEPADGESISFAKVQ